MKYRYGVDPHNQLTLSLGKNLPFLIIPGRFSIDKKNRLIYWLNAPSAWRRVYNLPQKIVFYGAWRLSKEHDLELVLEQSSAQYQGDSITIKGKIFSVDKESIAFEIKSRQQGLPGQVTTFSVLKLSVTWLSDEENRLCFIVNKPSPDIIVLLGRWKLNQNQQITYRYQRQDLKRKSKIMQEIAFEGFWQINSANKLTYLFKNSSLAKFEFRAGIESPSIYPQQGLIKYRLGAGLSHGRKRAQTICLYGEWKFSRQIALSFQMDYGGGQVKGINFSAEVKIERDKEIVFALQDKAGEPLGFSLYFSYRFLQRLDAQAFIRLKHSLDASGVDVGVRIPF